jgi:hypothetical protein
MRTVVALGLACLALVVAQGSAAAAPTDFAPDLRPATLAMEADLKDALNDLEAKGSRPFSLELNPFMGIVAGAASGNVEYVPAQHFGLIVSPRASLLMPAWAGEVGARYWTGKRREASGFFLGPSAIYGRTRGEGLYGLAVDTGVQTIFDDGITLGAGVGVQYLTGAVGNSALEVGPLESGSKVEHAVLPRLLFSVGYSL